MVAAEKPLYIALHEPRHVLSTVEHEQGDERQTVRDIVEVPGDLYPVSRLGFENESLGLMTNDNGLTNRLPHARLVTPKSIEFYLQNVLTQINLNLCGAGSF